METLKNLVGFLFFMAAAVLSANLAWKTPTLLAWLGALHNLLLAFVYLLRQPAAVYDRKGLWLGLIAALLPSAHALPHALPPLATAIGAAGYCLVLWSLCSLGTSFGVAPADRGLIVQGPYRFVRHPMYLGEILLRFTLALCSPEPIWAGLLAVVLLVIQVARILREEQWIRGYRLYAGYVRWRFVPGVW